MPVIAVIILIVGTLVFGAAVPAPSHLQRANQPPIQATPILQDESQTLIPSPTPTIQPTVAPTPKPKVKGITTKKSLQKEVATPKPTDSDLIITCRAKSGEAKQMKKSECDQMVNCQIGDKWLFLKRDECLSIQGQRQQQIPQAQEGMVNCQTKTGLVVMKKEDCARAQQDWNSQIEEQVKKELHEKTLRDYEQELLQRGLTREEIDAELYRLDQALKQQGL